MLKQTEAQAEYPRAVIAARGPVSEQLLASLRLPAAEAGPTVAGFAERVELAVAASADLVCDDDLQLTLFILQCLQYGGLVEAATAWAWGATLMRSRVAIDRLEGRTAEIHPRSQ